jgi:hypothetical protein
MCPYCVSLVPTLNVVKAKYRHNPQVQFRDVELSDIPEFEKQDPLVAKELNTSQIHSVPDLRMVVQSPRGGLKSSKYTGNRTIEDITNWINKAIREKKHRHDISRKRRTTRKSRRRTKSRKVLNYL